MEFTENEVMKQEAGRLEPIRLNFAYFAGLSLIFGLVYCCICSTLLGSCPSPSVT